MKFLSVMLVVAGAGILVSAYLMATNYGEHEYCIIVKTDEQSYLLDDEINIWIEVRDYKSRSISFPSSKIADFCIYRDGVKIYQWSDNKTFLQVITPLNLSKGFILLEAKIPANILGNGTFEIKAWMEKFYEDNELHPEIYADSIFIDVK